MMARGKPWLFLSGAILFVLIGVALMFVLVRGASGFVATPQLASVLGVHWNPLSGHFGYLPFVVGTVVTTVIALVIAVPLSMGMAVTVARELSLGWRSPLLRLLTTLSAVPSVIYGWWGLTVVVPLVRRYLGGAGFSLLAAGIVLSLMLVPTLTLLFEANLKAVPVAWEEGALALGGTDDQILMRLLIPAAFQGLVRSVLVATTRAVGETMAVQMVIGGQVAVPHSLLSPGATLTSQLLTDLTLYPPGTVAHGALDGMAILLMVMMYAVVRVTRRLERRG